MLSISTKTLNENMSHMVYTDLKTKSREFHKSLNFVTCLEMLSK